MAITPTYFTKSFGESFYRIRLDESFFVDNSEIIRVFEETERHILLCRPRRFGKSLVLSMLHHYYDETKKADFATLFGSSAVHKKALAIGLNPTGKQNTYKVLHFDLSGLQLGDQSVGAIEKAITEEILSTLEDFRSVYGLRFDVDNNIGNSFRNMATELNEDKNSKLLVLVDEYDRYTNDVLHLTKPDNLEEMLSPLDRFYQSLKKLVQQLSIADYRSVTMGVLPLAIASFSSWNCFRDVTMSADFADYFGFKEEHILETIKLIEPDQTRCDTVLATMRDLLNGYCFFNATCTLFNPQYSIRFFANMMQQPSFRKLVTDKPVNDWSRDETSYVIANGDPCVNPRRFYQFMLRAPACSTEFMLAFNSDTYAHLRYINVADMFTKRMYLDRLLTDIEQLRWFMLYQGFLTFDVDPKTTGWLKMNIPLRLPNAVMRNEHYPELMGQIELKRHLLERLWENVSADNLRNLIEGVLSELKTDYSNNRFNESGFQACLEYAVGKMCRETRKHGLQLRAHFNQTKHECDLAFTLNTVVPSSAGDSRDEAILIELKRLTSADVTVPDPAFDGAKSTVVSNCLVGLSNEAIVSLKLKNNAKTMFNALDVAGAISSAKKQVKRQAEDLRCDPQWSSRTLHLFVAFLIVDRVYVESAGSVKCD